MKKFQFRLQPLVLVRSLEEKRAREMFLTAHHERLLATEKLSAARREGEERYAYSLGLRTGRLSAAEYLSLQGELERAQYRVVEAMDAERAALEAEEVARNHWIASRLELKVVERLRANAVAEHTREESRLEQGMLDELAVLRASATCHPLS